MRQCLTNLGNQALINLLIRQINSAFAQAVKRKFHGKPQTIQGILLGPGAAELGRQSNLRGSPHRLGIHKRAVMVEKNCGGKRRIIRHRLSLPGISR